MPTTRYVVRYGAMRHLGEFGARELGQDVSLPRGTQVVVRSHRGTEWGEVLTEATDRTRDLLGRTDSSGKIVRVITRADEQQRDEARRQAQSHFDLCRETIAEFGLPMQLVDVEHLLGGEKIIFFYTAEDRVDFRELVRALAKKFKTRIEMRQIGIRDEAKLLADYGDCGKPVCCNTHLQEMPKISMKMAKVQKASLDPNKISGRCGRLKCCLRYEFDTYVEHQKELPKTGKWVETDSGVGKVIAQEILAKKLLVSFEGGRRMLIDAAAVQGIVPAPPKSQSSTSKPKQGRDNKSGSKDRPRRSSKPYEKRAEPSSNSTTTTQPADDTSSEAKKKTRRRRSRRRRKPKGDAPPENGPTDP